MSKRILYKNEEGGVSIVVPSPNTVISIEQIALKDVPTGVPFKIVDTTEVSSDRTFRNAWEVDEADMTDGVGD